jgi:hypothetical protein
MMRGHATTDDCFPMAMAANFGILLDKAAQQVTSLFTPLIAWVAPHVRRF